MNTQAVIPVDVDLSTIYTTNGYPGTSVEGAVLRCTEHPEWEIDADGNMLPGLIHRAIDHVKEAHVGGGGTRG